MVINEIHNNPPSSDNGKEWFELYNPSCDAVELDGWTFERATNINNYSVSYTFGVDVDLASLGYIVVGGEDVDFADLNSGTALNMGNAGNSGDAVRIKDDQAAVVDTVVYGPNNDDNFLDDGGEVADPAPLPTTAKAYLVRIPNGSDTDDSSVDFDTTGTATPGAAN